MFSSRLILLLSLVATTALAQDGLTRGDSLRRREYQTYATTNLFVDPTGSDTGACTSSGTTACATLTGALSKLPARISNNVTITVAAGTYTDTVTIRGFISGGGSNSPTLTVQSSLAAAPVSAATGTSTAFTDAPDTGTVVGVLEDTSKSWTVDELKGYFLEITSGAQTGAVRPIISNDSRNVRFVGSFATDPIVGVSFRISRPGAVWSSNGISTMTDNSVNITVSGIDQTTQLTAARNFGTVTFSLLRIITPSSASAVSFSGGRYTFTASSTSASFLQSATGPGLNVAQVPTSAQISMVSLGTMFVRTGSVTSNAAMLLSKGNQVQIQSTSAVYAQGSPTSVGVIETNTEFVATNSTRTNLYIDCAAAASTTALRSNQLAVTSRPSLLGAYTISILDCTTGVSLGNGSTFNLSSGGTWTTTGVTTEILLDATAYSYSTVNGFSGSFVASPKGTRFSVGSP